MYGILLTVLWEREVFPSASEELEEYLWKDVPHRKEYYSYEALRKLADLFAGIIDYKSEFTGRHSLGVAAKAAEITEYMGYDRDRKSVV